MDTRLTLPSRMGTASQLAARLTANIARAEPTTDWQPFWGPARVSALQAAERVLTTNTRHHHTSTYLSRKRKDFGMTAMELHTNEGMQADQLPSNGPCLRGRKTSERRPTNSTAGLTHPTSLVNNPG